MIEKLREGSDRTNAAVVCCCPLLLRGGGRRTAPTGCRRGSPSRGRGLFPDGPTPGGFHPGRGRAALGGRRLRGRAAATPRRRLAGAGHGPPDGPDVRSAEARDDDPEVLGQDQLQVTDIQGLRAPVLGQPDGLLRDPVQKVVRQLQDLFLGVGLDPVVRVDRFHKVGDPRADEGRNVGAPAPRLGGGGLLGGTAGPASRGASGGRQGQPSLRECRFCRPGVRSVRGRLGDCGGLRPPTVGGGGRGVLATPPMDGLPCRRLFLRRSRRRRGSRLLRFGCLRLLSNRQLLLLVLLLRGLLLG